MRRAAIIKDSKIINFTRTTTLVHPDGLKMVYTKKDNIGDSHNASTGKFTTPPPKPEPPREINLNEELTRAEKVKQINQMVADGVLTTARAAEIKGGS